MDKKKQYIKSRVLLMQQHYDVTYQTFKNNSDHFYNSIVNNPKLMSMLEEANSKDLSIKNKARMKLANIFKIKYQLVHKLGIDIIHFHLPDNKSFFRRHKQDKFGDDLTSVRYSVVQTNKTKKPIHGLEIGKHGHAFRFVYPILNKNKQHIGSMEGSTSSSIFIEFMENTRGIHTHFLIKKDELYLDDNDTLDKYAKANGFKDYLRLKLKTDFRHTEVEKNLIRSKIEKFDIPDGKPFSILIDKNVKEDIVIFLPILNILKEKTIAYLIAFDTDNEIELIKNNYKQQQIIGLLISLLLTFLIFRVISSKQILKRQVDQKTKELKEQIDTEVQKNKEIRVLNKTVEERKKELKIINENLQVTIEEKTKEQNQLLSIFDKGDSVLLKLNHDEHRSINYVSTSIIKLLGYKASDFYKNNISYAKCIFKEDLERVRQEVLTASSLNSSDYFQHKPYRVVAKEGKVKWVIAYTLIIRDENNNIIYYLGHINDITELKNREIKLFKSEKMASMGEMIGNIAHQWRQPLSIISTASTGMKIEKEYGTLSDEQFNKNCDLINTHAQYLSRTIDDFRNFIKDDRVKTIFSLKNDIEGFLHIVDGSIKINYIKVILNIDNDIKINGYGNELIQCFINIFNNSKDVLKERKIKDKLIFISTSTNKDKAIIKIKDNAGGISQEIIDKIFQPYFTTKHQSQGTGLGLHMTYNLIVDGMNGTIEANNKSYEYEGKDYLGAEFVITLPM